MEYALWDGKKLEASKVGEEYEYEKSVREASASRRLFCQDEFCTSREVKYCHGKIRPPYFAHISDSDCDYARFEKTRSEDIAQLSYVLFEVLKSKGVQVKRETKLLEHHYSHLSIYKEDTPKTAVEIIKKTLTVHKSTNLLREYEKKGVNVSWIELGDVELSVDESATFFGERFSLNENNKTLLVVDNDMNRVAEYRMDQKSYVYRGTVVLPAKEIFIQRATASQLTYENEFITIEGFEEKYQKWIKERKEYFEDSFAKIDKHIAEEEIKEAKRQEFQQRKNEELRRIALEKKKLQDIENERIQKLQYESRKEEYKELDKKMDDETNIVCDSTGRRVIKCRACGRIGYDNQFAEYGGGQFVNYGICKECINGPQNLYCPECGSELVMKSNGVQRYYECKEFPDCTYRRDI